MNAQAAMNCEKLRAAFEGREAIYTERGVLRVRVFNIRPDVAARRIDAMVQEIPTVGLEQTIFHRHRPRAPRPLEWKIGGGFLTVFSKDDWGAGYGGWHLYFAPEIIQHVVTMAANWPPQQDDRHRYTQAMTFIQDQAAHQPITQVFLDEPPIIPE
jgi:hypothetical protein